MYRYILVILISFGFLYSITESRTFSFSGFNWLEENSDSNRVAWWSPLDPSSNRYKVRLYGLMGDTNGGQWFAWNNDTSMVYRTLENGDTISTSSI